MTIAGTDLADTPAAAGLRAAKRVVIKVGSALLVDETTGRLRDAWLRSLADDIARMRARGQEVIVVSSGAIALGRRLQSFEPKQLPSRAHTRLRSFVASAEKVCNGYGAPSWSRPMDPPT